MECEVADLDSMVADSLISSVRISEPPRCCVILRASLLGPDCPNRDLVLPSSQEIVHNSMTYRAVEIQDVELDRDFDSEWYRLSFTRPGLLLVNNVRLSVVLNSIL